ncbi:MAG: NAD-dependent epimerase/dehydratase family protein [Bacteroidetes bacterium]|nr:NAD-dependent epimerase/dehydratase family protein [Bacteroidota bacterium]
MKIFVTGATGYIGFNVANKFRQNGFKVYGLTRSTDKAKKLYKNEIGDSTYLENFFLSISLAADKKTLLQKLK